MSTLSPITYALDRFSKGGEPGLMAGRRTSPRKKRDPRNPLTPFVQEMQHPLQQTRRRFNWAIDFGDNPRKYNGMPQRYAFSPSYASMTTTKYNTQAEAMLRTPKHLAPDERMFVPSYKKAVKPKDNYTAPYVARGNPSTRFGCSPSQAQRLSTRRTVLPEPMAAGYAPERERLRRKVGPSRLWGQEEMLRQEKERTEDRRWNRSVRGKFNEKRAVDEFDRLSSRSIGWHENRIKNMSSLRNQYASYQGADHKSRFKKEFPHVGPQVTTVMRKTPKHMLGHKHSYSIRFDQIGIRKQRPQTSAVQSENKKLASVFWKAGVKGNIDKAVQMPNPLESRIVAASRRRLGSSAILLKRTRSMEDLLSEPPPGPAKSTYMSTYIRRPTTAQH